MEENIVLQVVLHEGEGLEIRVGREKINPLMLVGILEQVKLNILTGDSNVEELTENPFDKEVKPKYDA